MASLCSILITHHFKISLDSWRLEWKQVLIDFDSHNKTVYFCEISRGFKSSESMK